MSDNALPRTPFDGLRSTNIWGWRFGRPSVKPRSMNTEVLLGNPIGGRTMQGARRSGVIGVVQQGRGLGQNACPSGYVRTADGRCTYQSTPSAMFPSSSYPASAMISPQIGITVAISRGRPSGTF